MEFPILNACIARGIAALLLCQAGGLAAAADAYPSKPVRIIVASAAGGGLDAAARLVAPKMSENLGQPVVVENRPGGDTLLGTRLVKNAPADGYTILAQANGFTAVPALRPDAGYDPVKDFSAIGVMLYAPQVMLVGPDQPDRTVPEFIARARANPGQLTYASAGVGGPPHLGAALFLQKEGLDVVHVPYKGNAAALPDVATGRVSMIFGAYAGGASYLQGGRLRALGITGTKRLAVLPDVPTFAEQGVDFTYHYWLGLVAPAGTPTDVVQRLAQALQDATSSPAVAERLRAEGAEPMSLSPREFQEYLSKEAGQMDQLLKGLKSEKD